MSTLSIPFPTTSVANPFFSITSSNPTAYHGPADLGSMQQLRPAVIRSVSTSKPSVKPILRRVPSVRAKAVSALSPLTSLSFSSLRYKNTKVFSFSIHYPLKTRTSKLSFSAAEFELVAEFECAARPDGVASAHINRVPDDGRTGVDFESAIDASAYVPWPAARRAPVKREPFWRLCAHTASETHLPEDKNVHLERVRLLESASGDRLLVILDVLVRNLGFEKQVRVVQTSDNWRSAPTWSANGLHHSSLPGGGVDRFQVEFELEAPPAPVPPGGGVRVEFAISCAMGGVTHWDNRSGANHVVDIVTSGPQRHRRASFDVTSPQFVRTYGGKARQDLAFAQRRAEAMSAEAKVIQADFEVARRVGRAVTAMVQGGVGTMRGPARGEDSFGAGVPARPVLWPAQAVATSAATRRVPVWVADSLRKSGGGSGVEAGGRAPVYVVGRG
ncbi:hypothetical protein HK101_011961 [Irineochytrium annulatum]|nr:hypothetical protein HK101_011961 [Irineochytrium annulatum]